MVIPALLRVTKGRFQFIATLPYLRIDAPANVIGGGGNQPGLPIIIDSTEPTERRRREGVGDLRLGAVYTLPVSTVDLSWAGEGANCVQFQGARNRRI